MGLADLPRNLSSALGKPRPLVSSQTTCYPIAAGCHAFAAPQGAVHGQVREGPRKHATPGETKGSPELALGIPSDTFITEGVECSERVGCCAHSVVEPYAKAHRST